jgi:hypothetical protein
VQRHLRLRLVALAAKQVLLVTVLRILDGWVPTGDAWSPTGNPADCGGTVCSQKSRSPLTAPGPRRKRAKAYRIVR